jgi:hypothetical protein
MSVAAVAAMIVTVVTAAVSAPAPIAMTAVAGVAAVMIMTMVVAARAVSAVVMTVTVAGSHNHDRRRSADGRTSHHNRRRNNYDRGPMMPVRISNRNTNREISRVCILRAQACEHHHQHGWNKDLFHILPYCFLRCCAHMAVWTRRSNRYSRARATATTRGKSRSSPLFSMKVCQNGPILNRKPTILLRAFS